jgi:hypothetical protein
MKQGITNEFQTYRSPGSEGEKSACMLGESFSQRGRRIFQDSRVEHKKDLHAAADGASSSVSSKFKNKGPSPAASTDPASKANSIADNCGRSTTHSSKSATLCRTQTRARGRTRWMCQRMGNTNKSNRSIRILGIAHKLTVLF